MQIRFQGGVLILEDPQGVQEPTLNTTCFQERIQETDTFTHFKFFETLTKAQNSIVNFWPRTRIG
jgi:hypothetical protein